MSRPLFNLDGVHIGENAVHRQWQDLSEELEPGTDQDSSSGQGAGDMAAAERCLVPLLREMRWQGNDRLLFEAMPHFDRVETLQQLRTVLTRLNVRTEAFHGRVAELNQAHFPCLRVTEDDVQVIAGRAETGDLRAYSGKDNEAIILAPAKVSVSEIYLAFEDKDETGQTQSNRSWFSSVTQRFRTSIFSILALGFVLNILALGPRCSSWRSMTRQWGPSPRKC